MIPHLLNRVKFNVKLMEMFWYINYFKIFLVNSMLIKHLLNRANDNKISSIIFLHGLGKDDGYQKYKVKEWV